MITKSFDYNHGTLHYSLTGEGETVTFIHGFSLDSRMWQPQVEFFSKHYQVLTYDLRGHGKSSLPVTPYSYHNDLKQLLDHLGINKTHLVGLSLGGEIALDFTIAYPDYLTTLALLDSSINGFQSTVNWEVSAQEQGVEQAKQNWLQHPIFATSIKNAAVRAQLEQMLADYSGWHWLHSGLREKLDPSALMRLQEVKIPTLVIVGESDLSYYHHIAKVLVEKIPQVKLEIIPGAGHMVNLEATTRVNELLSEGIRHNFS